MATFVVATNGLDTTGTGSSANPWRTVKKALDTVAPGDVIEQRGGTYSTTGDSFFKNSRDTVTIQNYANEDVTNQNAAAGDATTNPTGYIWCFENSRPNGITIRKNPLGGSLTFRNSPAPPIPSASVAPGGKNFSGIRIQYVSGSPSLVGASASGAPPVTLDGVTITDMRGQCVYSYQTGVVVRNCDFSHGSIGVYVESNVGFNCPGTLIEDNHLHHMDKLWQDKRILSGGNQVEGDDAGAMGVHINKHRGLSGGAIVRNNIINNNTTYSSGYGRDGAAFEPFRSSLWEFYGNEVYDNECIIETGTNKTDGTYVNLPGGSFHHNFVHGYLCTDATGPAMLFRTGNGSKIYNNTFVLDGGNSGPSPHWMLRFFSEGGGFGEAVTNTQMFNNIIANGPVVGSPGNLLIRVDAASGAPTPTFTMLDYNLLYSPYGSLTQAVLLGGVGTYTLSSAQLTAFRAATAYSDHDQWAVNPLLNADGTLAISSPAINAGLHVPGLTDGYIGSAPDIGAFEYVFVAPSATANAITALGTGKANSAGAHGSGQSILRIYMT